MTVRLAGHGRVVLAVDSPEVGQRLADELFGRRYETRPQAAATAYLGEPV